VKKRYRTKIVTKVLPSFLLGVLLLTTTLAHTPTLAQLCDYNPQGLGATTLEEVLALPDEEIDLATAIMILHREWDPSFDATGSLEEIERMAVELEMQISSEDNPERVVSLINQYLFEESTYSATDPGLMKDLELSALPYVIENRKGTCLGLSLIYLALAERLGLPFYGVAAPGHIFVRYDDGRRRINIETTDKGKRNEDSDYENDFMLHPTYTDHNFYLRNLLKREVIGFFANSLGIAYHKKGMYDEAIVEYERALEINPNHALVYHNLGSSYGMKGMYDEAIGEYKKGIELNPNSTEAHNNLGAAYFNKGMYDDAIAECKKALEINPNDAEAHNNLGVAYDEKGMCDEAIAEYKKALEINPNDAEAHNNLGVAYEEKGLYDEAIVEYEKAIEISPDHADAHYNLGSSYGMKEMHDEAIAEFKKAVEINPNDADAHNNLAVVYYAKGEHSLAIEHCDKVIELGYRVHPEFLEALEPYREK